MIPRARFRVPRVCRSALGLRFSLRSSLPTLPPPASLRSPFGSVIADCMTVVARAPSYGWPLRVRGGVASLSRLFAYRLAEVSR